MKEVYDKLDKIIPHGEFLRGFCNQTSISKFDLRDVLKKRGVFNGNDDKEYSVPILTSTLLSPSEFENLSSKVNKKEDNKKRNSSTLTINNDAKIINILPARINIHEVISTEYENFKIINVPVLKMIDDDENILKLEIEIERNDVNKSWYESKNIFKANLIIKKEEGDVLTFLKEHTSKESLKVINAYQDYLVKKLKEANKVDEKEKLKKILFGDFSNEERILFFVKLCTTLESSHFEFVDIVDLEFKPDESLALHQDIHWMENKKRLTMNGKNIHKTFFFENTSYRKHLICWGIRVVLKYKYELYDGYVSVNFGFPDYQDKLEKSEFEINIGKFNINQNVSYSEKNQAKRKIFNLLESEKNKIYKYYQS